MLPRFLVVFALGACVREPPPFEIVRIPETAYLADGGSRSSEAAVDDGATKAQRDPAVDVSAMRKPVPRR